MNETVKIGARLTCAASLLSPCRTVIDVGTDHAYLPLYLVQKGIVQTAIASDVNAGPLAIARRHIAELGLEGKIETKLTNGLQGLETSCPDAIFVLGMGGELIVSILEGAPWVKDPHIQLVLQPMTKVETLRAYLAASGFQTEREVLSREEKDNRIYQTLSVRYDGVSRSLSPLEALAGKETLANDPLYRDFLAHLLALHEQVLRGLREGNRETAEVETLLAGLRDRLSECRKETV